MRCCRSWSALQLVTIHMIINKQVPMINPFEQKKMLIESMKKLVSHVSNNRDRQLEIFQALSNQDLTKIIINLKDDNQYLRRISALLLCQLFFLNEQNKQKAVRLLQISPGEGRVCLGGIPESISKYPSTLKRCLELMKTPLEEEEQYKMCWVINLERKILKLQTMDYKKYSSFTFLDPYKNIFGFTIAQQRKDEGGTRVVTPTRQQQGKTYQQDKAYQQGKTYQQDKAYQLYESPKVEADQVNLDFYKNYVEARKKTTESKRNSFQGNYINLNSGASTDRVPGTPNTEKKGAPHLSVTLTPSSRRQSMRNSMDFSNKTPTLSMTMGRNSIGMGQTNISSHNSSKQYVNLGKTIPSTQYGRFEVGEIPREQIKLRGPRFISTRESSIPSEGRPHQDRFFNRVKDILQK